MFNCPPVIVPVVAWLPRLIGPKSVAIEPPAKVPVEVREEFKTSPPSVVAFRTETLLILNTLPDAIFQSWLEVQLFWLLMEQVMFS